MELHERIKFARENAGISQVEMAKRMEVARQTYLDMETGKTDPKVAGLIKFCKITNSDFQWVATGQEPNEEVKKIRELSAELNLLTSKLN